MLTLINNLLDPSAIRQELEQHGLVQINNYLPAQTAQILHDCLDQQVPWSLAYSDQGIGKQIKAERLATMSPAEIRQATASAYEQSPESFHFVYNTFRVIDSWMAGEHKGHLLHSLANQMHTPQHLEYVRKLSGKNTIARMDVMAARYLSGHFLTPHDDAHHREGREVTYILNLSRNWLPEWGGLLHLLDADQERITQTFVPTFNSMVLFYPPRWHFVSQVAGFARLPRYTITGWMLNA